MDRLRIGFGTDVHRLETGRPLILGGVEIPSRAGAVGHSDADVLLHAVTDAIFGALALGDIGTHFPDDDDQWKGAESTLFLSEALGQMRGAGCHIANLDAVVSLESPRLGEHKEAIRASLCSKLDIGAERVNIKAKSAEGLGPVGEQMAVRAEVVLLLERD